MKRLWQWCGIAAFWLSWPGSWLYLKIGSRTRVLVVVGDEILVVKGWLGSGKWILPGGGLHRGEDVRAGALRELREETGLQLQSSQLTQLYQTTFRQYGFSFPYTCYRVNLPEKPGLRKQLLEIAEVAWIPRSSVTPNTCQSDVTTAVAAQNL